ncbi:MAG: 4Fe-4S binding protein [Desulfobacteraceae bacterium]|nr:MAG: 4Fe-4S binding protein [Desulfobacteraceae bacterium]
MRIITTRRISQSFFFLLFVWLCIVTTLGERWWQLRGWPVNWFLQLDPLIGLSVWLSTRTVYAGLLWGVVTIALTLVLGRFFCGWMCPFGSAQHFMGHLGKRGRTMKAGIARNRPHKAQAVKYWILLLVLAAAAGDLFDGLLDLFQAEPIVMGITGLAAVVTLAAVAFQWVAMPRKALLWIVAAGGLGAVNLYYDQHQWLSASLQTGLLDPIAMIYRTFNLVLLPIADAPLGVVSAVPRVYPAAGLIGILFLLFLLLSLRVPRFYCRFVCPLGALFGWLSRWSIWRIGQYERRCTGCLQCETDCEGACAPAETIRTPECVLCLNCLTDCGDGVMGYTLSPSAGGQQASPDLSRRQVVTAVAAGLAAVPMLRVGGGLSADWNPAVIRPPGALGESLFLARCIKCGQCMRICPTNTIQPAGLQSGWEGLWTPLLNFRTGTSGCQSNCVACSRVCPTAALRPLSVDERLGRNRFVAAGPLRLGTAFVDRGRCLPWAMDTPCIVCQENCPLSPKAIFTRDVLQPVRNGVSKVRSAAADSVVLENAGFVPGQYGTGDFFGRIGGHAPRPIVTNTENSLTFGPASAWPRLEELSGRTVEILVRLQQPHVDPRLCIGCGVCEHECPVQGLRAIRVTAENESRQRAHKLILN